MKPENVLYASRSADSPLLVTDFGLSCRCKPGQATITDWCGTAPYMAPEVFRCSRAGTAYGPECDLWSVGVLVYILLTGYMPFDGPEKVIEANVTAGRYSMQSNVVGTISAQAKDFIRGLLTVDPAKRLSADAAIRHPWIAARSELRSETVNSDVAQRLKRFAKHTRLEKRLRFLVAQCLSIDEIAGLRAEFEKLDVDGSGKISHQARGRGHGAGGHRGLTRGGAFSSCPRCAQELQTMLQSKEGSFRYHGIVDVMKSLDADSDGQIDIVEFVAAALDVKLLLDDEKLRAAFQRMDLNHDGLLSMGELMAQLDGDPVVYDLMTEGDKDADGRLDIDEFRTVMKKRVSAVKAASRLPTRGVAAEPSTGAAGVGAP